MADDKDDKNRTASQLAEVLTYSVGAARATYSHLSLAAELAGKIRQNTMAGKLMLCAALARMLEREVADVQTDLARIARPTLDAHPIIAAPATTTGPALRLGEQVAE